MLFFTRSQLAKYYARYGGLCPNYEPVPDLPRRTRKNLRVFCLWPQKMWPAGCLSRSRPGQTASWDRDRDALTFYFFFLFFFLSQCPNNNNNNKNKKKNNKKRFLYKKGFYPPGTGTLGHRDTLEKIASSSGVAR